MLNYLLHEQNCAALAPVHAASQAMRFLFTSPLNPHSHTIYGRAFAAGCEVSSITRAAEESPNLTSNPRSSLAM